MSDDPTSRPWWASDHDGQRPAPEEQRPAPDPDPLARHRAARRGEAASADDDGSWWRPAAEALSRLSRDLAATATANAAPAGTDPDDGTTPDDRAAPHRTGDGTDAAHGIDTCGICPICVGLRALGDARPDLLVHLSEAARHVAIAVRSVVEAAAEEAGDGHATQRTQDGLTRIDLDDEPPT